MQMYRSDKKFSVLFFIENIYSRKLCIFKVFEYMYMFLAEYSTFETFCLYLKSRCNTINNIIFRAFSGKERYNSRLGSTQQHLYHMGQVLFNSLKVDWQ